jgi:hypothetical protein
MSGSGAEKRYQADAMRAAKLAAEGWTHRNIAELLEKKPEQIKAMILRGERLLSLGEK